MKILVTGSEGFIGSHLVEKLVKNGHDLTCLVLYNSFNSWGWLDKIDTQIKKNIKVVTGDIRDEFFIKNLLKKKIDIIINLAALIGIPYSYRSPKSYFDTNSLGLINILNSAINSNVKKIIHTSTSEVYGTPKYVPIDEKHLVSAQSPYAASKIAADQVALSYNKSFNLPITILRPFNTFGPRQSLRAIIPTIITQIIRNNNRVLRLGSLHPTRDLTYIDDTTDAFLASIKKTKDIGEIINIGSEFEISIGDLASKIFKIMGIKIKIKNDINRLRPKNSEIDRLISNSQKAKKILNWRSKRPKKLNFEIGLKKTIDWFLDEKNLRIYKSDIYND
jgi:NAD dependent epimerase/dehydratase